MSRGKKKNSIFRSAFYRIYFALVILALVGIAIGTGWLRGRLKDYESAQPKYVAEDVARLFESSNYEALYELDTSARQFDGGDEAFYVDSMKALTEGKDVAWTEAFSANENVRRYNVTVDGERFATFTLVPSGKTTAKGNRLWKLDSVTTNVQLREPEPEPTPEPEAPEHAYPCRITAPQGYAVTVDGELLTDQNAQLTEKTLFEEGFLPEDVPNPVLIDYTLDLPTVTPQITAVDENGGAVEVLLSTDKALTWTCPLKENDSYRVQYSNAALALGRQVAKFTSQDAEKDGILKVCAKDSPASQIFENLSNTYYTRHSKVSFRNEEASDFYVLTENCFTCRVTFDFVLKTTQGDMVYPTVYTFCVVHDESNAKLYNIQIS